MSLSAETKYKRKRSARTVEYKRRGARQLLNRRYTGPARALFKLAETKYSDTPSVNTMQPRNTGFLVRLTDIDQGTDSNFRIGRQITVTKIFLNMHWSPYGATTWDTISFYVVYDSATTDTFFVSDFITPLSAFGNHNLQYGDRFRVLWRRTISCAGVIPGAGLFPGGTDSVAKVDARIRCECPVTYTHPDGALPAAGHIYLVIFGSRAFPNGLVTYNWRVGYKDC